MPLSYPRQPARVLVDPRDAASFTLAQYLAEQCFYVWKGKPPFGDVSRTRPFRLRRVYFEWPDPNIRLEYPSASVVDDGEPEYQAHNLVPTPLDQDLLDLDAGTVVWKVAEAQGTFQLDFWADNVPVRTAIAAQLGGIFNPEECRSGVLLEGPKEFFCCPIRFTLLSVQRMDQPNLIYANERRLTCSVQWEAPVLDVRGAVPFQPRTALEVTEPGAVEDTSGS